MSTLSFYAFCVILTAVYFAAIGVVYVVVRLKKYRTKRIRDALWVSFVLLLVMVIYDIELSFAQINLPNVIANISTSGAVDSTFDVVVWALVGYLAYVAIHFLDEYGEEGARRRNWVNLLNIVTNFAPVVVVIFISWRVLREVSLWLTHGGVDIDTILIGAGFFGLVLGLALQDTLANYFSGLSILISKPFVKADLISLPDEKVCEVRGVGLRETELYNIDEHSVTYVPNSTLAGLAIVNITKPSVDLRVNIDVGVGYGSDLMKVKSVLEDIAWAQPNVLASDLVKKIEIMSSYIARLRKRMYDETGEKKCDPSTFEAMMQYVDRCESAKARLAKEKELNEKVKDLAEKLLAVMDSRLEAQCLEAFDKACDLIGEVLVLGNKWESIKDQLSSDEEGSTPFKDEWNEKKSRFEKLCTQWKGLRDFLFSPRAEQLTGDLLLCLTNEYKIIPPEWKNPFVKFLDFGASSVDLRLSFYVDDIRREHYERIQRIKRDVALEMHRRFGSDEENIEIPFPQTDIHFKEKLDVIGL